MTDSLTFVERRRHLQKEKDRKDWEAGIPKHSYCSCCGAKFTKQINQSDKGEHYTDCMWYEGDLPHDENPH